MANIIPGVPTPSDPSCALTYCGRIIAQVDCIKYIMQGTTACIDIQFFDANGDPLDLNRFTNIHIQLIDSLDCVVANFWYPDIPSGSKGFIIDILQETLTDGTIINKGLVQICLTADCTKISTGSLFVEILLTEASTGFTGADGEIFGIPCLMVGKILESKIYKNGGDGGCGNSGYVTGVF